MGDCEGRRCRAQARQLSGWRGGDVSQRGRGTACQPRWGCCSTGSRSAVASLITRAEAGVLLHGSPLMLRHSCCCVAHHSG